MIEELIITARAQFGIIFPCGNKEWNECITYEGSRIVLWFNTSDGSTHVVSK